MKQNVLTLIAILGYMAIVVSLNFFQKPYPVASMKDEIGTQLMEYMTSHQQNPIEPRKDTIFKFVPGLMGSEIDYELSYHNMMLNGQFDESLLVCKSIPYQNNPADFKNEPIYKGNEEGNYVSLLINVAWGEEELDKMITILDRLGVKANFFVEGRYAEKHKNQVAKLYNDGHLIGNHSYSHPSKWGGYTYDQYTEEIIKTNEVLSSIINEPITYFAPPGGEFNDRTLKAAADQGMYTILWTADTIDWKGSSADQIISRVMNKVEPGTLILMHPKPETVIALESMINQLKERGYYFKTVDEMVQGTRPECVN